MVKSTMASRVENVNPFNMIDFSGSIELKPFADNWVRSIQISGGTVRRTGGFNGSFIESIRTSTRPDTHIVLETSALQQVL